MFQRVSNLNLMVKLTVNLNKRLNLIHPLKYFVILLDEQHLVCMEVGRQLGKLKAEPSTWNS